MRFTVCVPCGWLAKSEPLFRIFSFVQSTVKHQVYFHMAISNRVDLNRSTCVKVALDRNEDLIMIDSDVMPLQPFDDVVNVLKEDKKGADVVLGIIASNMGILIRPFPKDSYVTEVEWGSLGFIYLPLKTLRKLKVIDWYKYSESVQYPMYFTYTPNMSEDVDFIIRMKKSGFKVIADKRIRLAHQKWANLIVENNGNINLTM
ncbi:hypothetical protein SFV1gp14 [Sulfolobus filamentous virus 1]|uniref:Glycosyltransferase n=2 Tax=Alphalipothrixvirus beppuense TaxID=2734584 RepID=A0A346LU53_SUFV1|nr:hypothetical protein HOT91_gp14 [Sulfolobus filamentous virus 1]AXQ00096.1 hypothetical protein SFV1gp14 [Sulfolobus filamentous virus 1]AZI75716.1 hypothetical protein SBFV1_gp15 [Sulfolobales Beppu filamentous phage 1]